MTLSEAREFFPHLKTDQIYFNHAAIGPWTTLAINRLNEFAVQRSGQKIENYQHFLRWNVGAKEKLGKLLNANPDRIAWVDNVSNGMNILAQGLSWKQGDRIIINDQEFPSNIYPFLNLKKEGVEIDIVKSENGRLDVEHIEKAITPKTKLVSISAVQFLTGYRADITAIGELCKKRKIVFCVDAIQAAGVVQIDVEKSNIDYLAGGTHKWLMSTEGASYIYLTEELQSRINQKFVGWTSVKDAWNFLDYNLTLRNTADKFQNGGVNTLGISILDTVLNLFIDFDMHKVEQRIVENTGHFVKRLTDIGIEPLLKGIPENNMGGIVTFKHDKANHIFEELEKRRIYCAMRMGMIRLSPHFYNNKDEIDKVVKILNEVKNR